MWPGIIGCRVKRNDVILNIFHFIVQVIFPFLKNYLINYKHFYCIYLHFFFFFIKKCINELLIHITIYSILVNKKKDLGKKRQLLILPKFNVI